MRDTFWSSMRSRRAAVSIALLAGMLAVAAPRSAHAESVSSLAEKLKSDDFRIRTQAALALGVTNDDGAVQPLCKALDDDETTVRTASAAALKKLGRSSARKCLKARLDHEHDEGVRITINRAIEALPAGCYDDNGTQNGKAKYYVAVSPVRNDTDRPPAEVECLVLPAIRGKLDNATEIQRAPSGESKEHADEIIKGRGLKGFYLEVKVIRRYADGNLTIKVDVTVQKYPGRSIIGSLSATRVAEGVGEHDKDSEKALIEAAAQAAGEKFTQNASAFL